MSKAATSIWMLWTCGLLITGLRADEPPVPQPSPRQRYVPEGAGQLGYVLLRPEVRAQGTNQPAERSPGKASQPLVVWLHPAGSLMHEELERDWWPAFEKAGCALMLPESASKDGWTPSDAGSVMRCIDDALVRDPRLSAKRVVLFGFSAGGQLALDLARTRGERLAGVVTMAAYPVSLATRQLALPPPAFKDNLSFFLICGRRDGGLLACRPAVLHLKKQGFHAILREVPGLPHAFVPGEKAAVVAWAASVEQGRQPVDPYAGEARPAVAAVRAFEADLLASKAVPVVDGRRMALGETAFSIAVPPDCEPRAPTGKISGQLLNAVRRSGDTKTALLGVMLHAKPDVEELMSGFIDNSIRTGVAAEEVTRGMLVIGQRSWTIRCLLTAPFDRRTGEFTDRLTVAACTPTKDDRSEWLVFKFDMPLGQVERPQTADWLRGVLASLDGG